MFLITKIKESKDFNKVLLNLLEKIPNNPLKKDNDFIEHTDWNLPKDLKREYVEYFLKIIRPYLEKIAISFKSKKISIGEIWFQQYIKSGVHQWHNHPYANWTNVYFVELPSKYLATEILNYDKEFPEINNLSGLAMFTKNNMKQGLRKIKQMTLNFS
jgi:hypothetical protein